ncbi:MLO-like protein 1 [Abeliophyllum distichum]|uniref:MLO-like protein 1 n=1 Tax=Abeliophyllum distichum TaxID=126358 RepID=A0ABD1Q1K7_9LAMI
MAGGGGGEGLSLEYTPTWVVALVCTIIVAISLVVERLLHYAGKYLLKKNQGYLFQAMLKIKQGRHLLAAASDNAGYCNAKTRQWRYWEDSIHKSEYDPEQALETKITHVQEHAFIRSRLSGIGRIALFSWLLLLAVGTKLEHIITQLAEEVAQKHSAVEGDLIVRPSDVHFWFQKPRLVLVLIHIILFQNSFEFAVFFWMLIIFGFDSCIMGQVGYIVPRLFIGVFVQFLCSYSTLPLYAIVSQMGSSFNKAIFDDRIKAGLVEWAQKAKKNKGLRKVSEGVGGSNRVVHQDSSLRSVEITRMDQEIQESF